MVTYLIQNATIVNEGKTFRGDVLIENGYISRIGEKIEAKADRVINADGLHLFPGVIDDQVHFREPGLTHKANIFSESRAAVAGGTTSFMEMPNTKPAAFTQELLQDKYDIGAATSLANYSFFMGASNDNLAEVLKTNPRNVCGLKIFMGSSTGNLLVDDPVVLNQLFSKVKLLIATHCEDEHTILTNEAAARQQYGEDVPFSQHPYIRSCEACIKSSKFAIELAKKYDTRLHILHISTAEETFLFDNTKPLGQKRITSEACVHHLWFTEEDYAKHGADIKCNPAIKSVADREAVWAALLDDRIDIIATDHAPHLPSEKAGTYFNAPSGLPLVQHSLNMMLAAHQNGRFSLERMVHKMSHAPALCFGIEKRGFIRTGYHADIVLVDLNQRWTVSKENLRYNAGWSPLEGHTFKGQVTHTFVSGHLAFEEGKLNEEKMGERMLFNA